MTGSIYNTARWKRLRALKLSEDPTCAPCEARGVIRQASHVDHIVAMAKGGESFPDLEGLMSMCASCHSIKTTALDRAGGKGVGIKGCNAHGLPMDTEHPFFGREASPATLVCGPPGSGKTSYVAARRRPGDLVLDLDAIQSALSGEPWYMAGAEILPFACQARDAVIDRLRRPHDLRHAWIITSGPKLADRHPLAESLAASVVVLEVSAAECKLRLEADERRPLTTRLRLSEVIDGWWEAYQPEPHTPLEGQKTNAGRPTGTNQPQLVRTRDWDF